MEWYSRGWRGRFAKSLEVVRPARVRISLTPPDYWTENTQDISWVFFFLCMGGHLGGHWIFECFIGSQCSNQFVFTTSVRGDFQIIRGDYLPYYWSGFTLIWFKDILFQSFRMFQLFLHLYLPTDMNPYHPYSFIMYLKHIWAILLLFVQTY